MLQGFIRRLSILMPMALSAAAALAFDGGQPVRYTIHGTVVDQNKAAIAGAIVTAIADGQTSGVSALTGDDGKFELTLLPGEYRLAVDANGFSRLSQRIIVKANELSPLEIVLQIAANIVTVTVSDSGGYQSQVISTATKTFTPLIDVPQSVSVTTRQQIDDQLLTSIGDVVRYVPGITAHQGENNRDQVIIRGQNSSADFFVNSVRDDVQYYRDLYNLDRIEILKGPNAMIFGRGGGGGVLNRVTKTAGFLPAREIVLQGGSYGNARAAVDVNQPVNSRLAFRGNGFFERSGSFRRDVKLKRFGINPTFTFNPDTKTSVTLGYEFFRDRRTADRGITSFQGRPADVARSTFYGNSDDSHVRSDVNLLTGSFDRQIGDLLVHNRTLYGDYDRFYQNYVPGRVTNDKTQVLLTAYNNATRRRNLFSQTDLAYTVSTGVIKHTILGGFEIGRQKTGNFRNTGYFNNISTSIDVPYDDPATTTPVTYRQSATDANNRLRLNLAAAYVQDQFELSRYVNVVGGIRFDYFDLKYHNNRNASDLRRIDRLVSPRLGVVVKPVTNLSIYGNYSVSYLPSSGDQFASLTVETRALEPEKFMNYEAGVKWDVRRNLSFTSAFYRLDRTNTRANDPTRPGVMVQTGSQRTNGVEIGLNGNPTAKWNVAGGYSYQDAFITSATTAARAGSKVGQVPRHSFSVWNKYQLNTKLGAGLGLIHRSDMFATIDNSVTLPGYTRADAAVYYSLSEKWRLQANVENVFNARYFLNADSNTNISPGGPRSLRIGLIARF